jgi:hypothetical protein
MEGEFTVSVLILVCTGRSVKDEVQEAGEYGINCE